MSKLYHKSITASPEPSFLTAVLEKMTIYNLKKMILVASFDNEKMLRLSCFDNFIIYILKQ